MIIISLALIILIIAMAIFSLKFLGYVLLIGLALTLIGLVILLLL